MKNSTTKTLETASAQRGVARFGLKIRFKIILASALLLATTNAVAGVIFVPVGNVYAYPELASVRIEDSGAGSTTVRTTGLEGEFTIDTNDLPPVCETAGSTVEHLSFVQHLELVINLSLGVVEGSSRGRVVPNNGALEFRASIQGNATCLPFDGRDCGQLIVDLELQGALSDPNDPAKAGRLRTQLLGSLIRDDADLLHWAALSANSQIAGNEALINSALEYAACHGAL